MSELPQYPFESIGAHKSPVDRENEAPPQHGDEVPLILRTAAQRQMRRFAKSADKRQSVHMLGSIEHLQNHFLKFGLASAERPHIKGPIQPALGPAINAYNVAGGELRAKSSFQAGSISPVPRYSSINTTSKGAKIDLEFLKKEATEALKMVDEIWQLSSDISDPALSSKPVDILDLLKTTSEAVRKVRAYSLALPSSLFPSSSIRPASASALRIPSGSFRAQTTISTPSRPTLRAVSSSGPSLIAHKEESTFSDQDPLVHTRRAALNVLTSLRCIEERTRQSGCKRDVPSTHDYVATMTPHADTPLAIDQDTTSNILVGYESRDDDEDLSFFFPCIEEEEDECRQSWYERLVVASQEGWIYQGDLHFHEDLTKERKEVRDWVSAVEERIFGKKGISRKPARLDYSVALRPSIEDELSGRSEAADIALPNWIDSSQSRDRLQDFLRCYLPLDLLACLPDSNRASSNQQLLNRLSDGYLLVAAHNAYLRRSPAAWGFIDMEEVHNTLSMDRQVGDPPDHTDFYATSQTEAQGVRREWTFRRAENLRIFGAAIKQRYEIPIRFPLLRPENLLTAPSNIGGNRYLIARPLQNARINEEGLVFDPLMIARKDTGWEDMLQAILDAWITAVVLESKRVPKY